ncbi:uncharacterized protein LOC117339448 [Pecten maximus]|uniref:uncharacterized protein LOC117339448 n=1 Tax=Pecten maximus TaxID=6579 RepID=UPI0014589C8F|nr:uncharacterized protein LOC117339448 [Pecten maximus]
MAQSGNLRIIDNDGTIVKPQPTRAESEKLLRKFNEDDSKKLLGIFNEELNDEEKDWTVKVQEKGPIVDIYCKSVSERRCQNDVDHLQELLQNLENDVIDCQRQTKSREEILKILNKEVRVVCIPSRSKGDIIRIYAKNQGDLDKARTKLMVSSERNDQKPNSRANRHFNSSITERDYPDAGAGIAQGGRTASPEDIKKTFQTSNGLTVKIYKGAITKLNVDSVVNAANERLANGAGVAGALSKAGGWDFDQDCMRTIRKNGLIPVTKNVVTKAGSMDYKGVVHAVGPQWYNFNDKVECVEKVRDTVIEILKTSVEFGFRSVAMPPISSGLFGVPTDLCAAMYVQGIVDFSKTTDSLKRLKEFHIIDIKDDILDMVIDCYEKWRKNPSALAPDVLVSRHPKVDKGKNYSQSWDDKTDRNSRQGRWHSQSHNQGRRDNQSEDKMDWNSKQGRHGNQDRSEDKMDWNSKQGRHGNQDRSEDKMDWNSKQGRHGQGQKQIYGDGQGYTHSHGGGQRNTQGQNQQGRGRPHNYKSCVFEERTKSFIFRGQLKVFFHCTDIVTLNVDAIVATDGKEHKGTISQAIEKANGSTYWAQFKDWLTIKKEGDVILAKPNKMKHLRCIYHIIMGRFSPSIPPSQEKLHLLKNVVLKVLEQANNLPTKEKKANKKAKESQALKKMAMSIPGAGSLETTLYIERCSEVMFSAIDEFTWRNKQIRLMEVHLVDMREEVVNVLRQTFHKQMNKSMEKRPLPPSPHPVNNPSFTASGRYDSIADTRSKKTNSQGKFQPERYRKLEEWKSSRYSSSRTLDIDEFVNRVPKQKGNMMILGGDSSTYRGASKGATGGDEDEDSCVICMDTFDDPVKLKRCGHMFCKDCISESFQQKPVCPVCATVYTVVQGDQPVHGTAIVYTDDKPLPGYGQSRTFIINYIFPDGTQDDEHPYPGESYRGLNRQAYLPDNSQGHKVLKMLKEAFEQRLTFTIGQSRTTGEDNVVTWNDIHHKTHRDGGPERYGYPDSDYLHRVTDELNAKGIGL